MNTKRHMFSGQHDDEEVLFVFRHHMIAMRKGFYGLLICFVLGSLPYLILPDLLWLLWAPVIGFSCGLVLFFYHWIGWYYSIFIVTTKRIEEVVQTGIFGKTVIDLDLSKIQNISYNIPGFSGEIFEYGTIVVQTYVGDLVIDKVYKPEQTYNQLQKAIYQYGGKPEILNEEFSHTQ